MSGIGIIGALLGGLASLLSPCSALLLPSFFAYAFDNVQLLVRRTVAFWLGLCVVLVPIGAGVGALGGAVTRYRSEVSVIGGAIIIGFGVITLLGGGFGFSAAQRLTARINISTTVSVIALGAVYGLAGFCAGPLLGAVLTTSAMGADPLYGGLLMAVYALGMAAPLFLLAALWERFDLTRRGWLRGRPVRMGPLHTHTTSLFSGLTMILIGVLFVATDGTANLGGVLSVDAQYDLQMWLSRVSSSVSAPAVLLPVAVMLLAWRGSRLWRRTRARDADQSANAQAQDVIAGGHGEPPSYYRST